MKSIHVLILAGLLIPIATMPMQQGLTKGQQAQQEAHNCYMKYALGYSLGLGLYANVLHLVSKAAGNDVFKIRNFQDWFDLTLLCTFCGGLAGIVTAWVNVVSNREQAFNNAIKTDAVDDCFVLGGVINTYPMNNNGKTALMAAAEVGAEQIFYALIQEGAKPTRKEYAALGKACEERSNGPKAIRINNASQGSAAYNSIVKK